MKRKIVNPVPNERGDETHPAWALIGASRVNQSPPGAVLFDSDIQHQHYVTVTLSTASRQRRLNHDWLHSERRIVEIAMSEAQWASFVSSMNVGQGVPCTLLYREREMIPGMPYEPRLAESMDEVHNASDKAMEAIREAFTTYAEHRTKANLRSLEYAIKNTPDNMAFAARSLSAHAENVVQRARADIEAMVLTKAEQLGLNPAELGSVPLLTEGEEES